MARAPRRPVSRRRFLTGGIGMGAGALLARRLGAGAAQVASSQTASFPSAPEAALAALGRTSLRAPGSVPFPGIAPGTDTLPGVEHIVVLMMENHSYDNVLGMLGRGPGQRPRGDGFTIGPDGRPTASNPYGDGRIQRSFRMPTTCQLPGQPSQEWEQSHIQYAGGALDGFVVSASGPVAMGYWTGDDLPFT